MSSSLGIGEEPPPASASEYMVNNHWVEIDAEFVGRRGGVRRRNGREPRYRRNTTAEKIANGIRLVAHGPAGHGSIPLQSNAIIQLVASRR